MFSHPTTSRVIILCTLAIGVTFLVSCKNSAGKENSAGEETTLTETSKGKAPASQKKNAGEEHDPPLAIADVPHGHWYCNMGTAHYTTTEKPEDGRCPVCGMNLAKKSK